MLTSRFAINWKIYGAIIFLFILFGTFQYGSFTKPALHVEKKSRYDEKGLWYKHPVEHLIASQQKYFQELLTRQSTTLSAAINEYRRRYTRDPPEGFDYWFSLAQEHDFVLIDEFDALMHTLEPFHGVSPHLLRQRMEMVQDTLNHRLGILDIQNGIVDIRASLFVTPEGLPSTSWLEKIPYNITVLLNSFDEPMVAVPWEELQDALVNSGNTNPPPIESDTPKPTVKPIVNTSGQSGWNASEHACAEESPARRNLAPVVWQEDSPTFIQNTTASADICQNIDIIEQHSMLIRPENLDTAHELVPIWSASKLSHFQDILYPSCYYSATRDEYQKSQDPAWNVKNNKFYWMGSTTGGHATEKNWRHLHRQRFVLKFASDSREIVPILKQVDPDIWAPDTVPINDIAEEFFDVKITNVVQCDEKACIAQKQAFNVPDEPAMVSREEAYRHKFLIDLDGNAFSGRFYRLLQSKSVVIKQTIMREWHDDRLIPWVHYVPLSLSYEELPELARFLAGTERGLELSQRIAEESTRWHDVALRDIDMNLVMFRMLLEYGRLMSTDT